MPAAARALKWRSSSALGVDALLGHTAPRSPFWGAPRLGLASDPNEKPLTAESSGSEAFAMRGVLRQKTKTRQLRPLAGAPRLMSPNQFIRKSTKVNRPSSSTGQELLECRARRNLPPICPPLQDPVLKRGNGLSDLRALDRHQIIPVDDHHIVHDQLVKCTASAIEEPETFSQPGFPPKLPPAWRSPLPIDPRTVVPWRRGPIAHLRTAG